MSDDVRRSLFLQRLHDASLDALVIEERPPDERLAVLCAQSEVLALIADRDRLAAENKKLRNEDTRDYELMEAAYQKVATDLAEAAAIVRASLPIIRADARSWDEGASEIQNKARKAEAAALEQRARAFLDRSNQERPE